MEMIITCAGCGKRYKGSADKKKYRCTTCANLLTFPERRRLPEHGKYLCSFCWSEIPGGWTATSIADAVRTCLVCGQKISARFHAAALASTEANYSSFFTAVAHDEKPPAEHAPARPLTLEERLTQATGERNQLANKFEASSLTFESAEARLAQVLDEKLQMELRIADLTRQLDNAGLRLQTLEAEKDETHSAREHAERKLQELALKNNQTQEKLDAVSIERDHAMQRVEQMRAEVGRSHEKLEQLHRRINASVELAQAEISGAMRDVGAEAGELLVLARQQRKRCEDLRKVAQEMEDKEAAIDLHSAILAGKVCEKLASMLHAELGTQVVRAHENGVTAPARTTPPKIAAAEPAAVQ